MLTEKCNDPQILTPLTLQQMPKIQSSNYFNDLITIKLIYFIFNFKFLFAFNSNRLIDFRVVHCISINCKFSGFLTQ